MTAQDIVTSSKTKGTLCRFAKLKPDDLRQRLAAINKAIAQSRSTYPLASKLMEHWVKKSGRRRNIMLSEVNFLDSNCGLPHFLQTNHRRVIARGGKSGIRGVKPNALGIEGRLKLAASHKDSLQPYGRTQTIRWQNTAHASAIRGWRPTHKKEFDLAIGLGTYTVQSQVVVRATKSTKAGNSAKTVDVLSWKVQVYDRYDWEIVKMLGACIGKQAFFIKPKGMPNPPLPRGAAKVTKMLGHEVFMFNDRWFAEVEQSGGAKPYEIYSEVFNAPPSVRTPFTVNGGIVRP